MKNRNFYLWIVITLASLNLLYLAFFAPNDAMHRVWFIFAGWVFAIGFVYLKEVNGED